MLAATSMRNLIMVALTIRPYHRAYSSSSSVALRKRSSSVAYRESGYRRTRSLGSIELFAVKGSWDFKSHNQRPYSCW